MHGSVTVLIKELGNRNPQAANDLWTRYFKRVAGLARKHLRKGNLRAVDDEDVAVSVFHRLYDGVQAGKFPNLTDRHNLWALLAQITAGKAKDALKKEGREKRGEGRVRGESVFVKLGQDDSAHEGIDRMMGRQVTPEFVVLMRDQCQFLLQRLNDDEQQVALLKLEGYTTHEIHDRLPDLSIRGIERRLNIIRRKWIREWEAITLQRSTPDSDQRAPGSD